MNMHISLTILIIFTIFLKGFTDYEKGQNLSFEYVP